MRQAIYIFILFGLVACGENSSKSEVLLRQIFDNLVIAATYDDVCTDSQTARSVNANLFGNMQMIIGLYKGEIKHNHPEFTQQDAERMVYARRDEVQQKAADLLADRGCDSEKGEMAQKYLKDFNTQTPPALFEQISAKLKEIGAELHIDQSEAAPAAKTPETH